MIIIISVLIWFLLCVYTDWKMYYANLIWKKKNIEEFEKYTSIYTDNFEKRYIKGLLFVFFPILLFISILSNGLKVLKNDRSIFSGDVL